MVKCFTCISLVISNVFIIVYIYIFYIFFFVGGGGCLADGLGLLIMFSARFTWGGPFGQTLAASL